MPTCFDCGSVAAGGHLLCPPCMESLTRTPRGLCPCCGVRRASWASAYTSFVWICNVCAHVWYDEGLSHPGEIGARSRRWGEVPRA